MRKKKDGWKRRRGKRKKINKEGEKEEKRGGKRKRKKRKGWRKKRKREEKEREIKAQKKPKKVREKEKKEGEGMEGERNGDFLFKQTTMKSSQERWNKEEKSEIRKKRDEIKLINI